MQIIYHAIQLGKSKNINMQIPDTVSLTTLATLGTIIGTGILLYRHFVMRPKLHLEIESLGDADHEGQVPLLFFVTNEGREYADDVYLVIHPNDWFFDFIDPDEIDAIFKTGEYTWETFPPVVNEFSKNFEQSHQIHLKTPVYEGVKQCITMRISRFETECEYELDYWVGCRGHSPRGGTITISLDNEGEVTIRESHDTLWDRIKREIPSLD